MLPGVDEDMHTPPGNPFDPNVLNPIRFERELAAGVFLGSSAAGRIFLSYGREDTEGTWYLVAPLPEETFQSFLSGKLTVAEVLKSLDLCLALIKDGVVSHLYECTLSDF